MADRVYCGDAFHGECEMDHDHDEPIPEPDASEALVERLVEAINNVAFYPSHHTEASGPVFAWADQRLLRDDDPHLPQMSAALARALLPILAAQVAEGQAEVLREVEALHRSPAVILSPQETVVIYVQTQETIARHQPPADTGRAGDGGTT